MGKQRPNINPPASLPPQHHHEVRRIQESLFSFFTPLRYPNLQFAKMSSPFSINGGACVAMVGKDCVAIACDLRLGLQSLPLQSQHVPSPRGAQHLTLDHGQPGEQQPVREALWPVLCQSGRRRYRSEEWEAVYLWV